MKHLFYSILLSLLPLASAWAQTEPTVTTDTRFARGATMAFGRAKFTAQTGNAIVERGFCWSSETKNPTIADSHSKDYLSNNGLIFWMKDLEPATVYYARAYAVARDSAVGYGDVIKIVTLPQGTITWAYDNGGNADENNRINSAVGSCVDYWNSLTEIDGLFLNVHYGAGTPTADCSYGGWMRVGPNASYQKTGTIMHEALHAIGVGTCDLWNGSSSPLRSGSGTGQWLGDRATEVLRFWDNSATATLNGDGTHMWPYGINGAHEDNGSELLYLGNSLLAQALGEDGLPTTGSRPYGLPYYSFDYADDTKYYIKNESETYGLYSSFLVETENHQLKWQQMTAAEAQANDAAAWRFSFTPDNQYYQIQNVATGRFVTYNSSGINGIVTGSAQISNCNFQLMRSRIDITSESGSLVTSQRGYWIMNPASGACLSANADGVTATASLNLANNSARQRWVILTAEQASEMENSTSVAARDLFYKNKSIVEAWAQVPHRELTEGADNTLTETLVQLTSLCGATSVTAEISELSAQILTAGKTFLCSVCVTDTLEPFNLTPLISNPGFDKDASGWTLSTGFAYGNQEVEYFEKTVSIQQTLNEMPQGTYRLMAQAFQRPGSYTDVYNAYAAGTNDVKCKLYLEKAANGILLKNIMADRQRTSLHSQDKQMPDGSYIPNTMASAAAWFAKGYYDNQTTLFHEAGNLRIGLSGANSNSGWWTIFDNFRLYYFGPLSLEEIATGIEEHCAETQPTPGRLFNLHGQPLVPGSKGFLIRGGKIVFEK